MKQRWCSNLEGKAKCNYPTYTVRFDRLERRSEELRRGLKAILLVFELGDKSAQRDCLLAGGD